MQNSYHHWISLIRSYRWNSLFVKYFKTIFCIVLLPFVLIAVLLISYVNTNLHYKQDGLLNEYMQKNFYTVEAMFNSINQQYLIFTTNQYCSAYFSSDILHSELLEAKTNIIHLMDLLKNTSLSLGYVQNVYLYSFRSDYIMTFSGGYPLEHNPELPFLSHYAQSPSSLSLFPVEEQLWIVYEYKPYNTPLGLVAFCVELPQLYNQLLYTGGRTSLLTADGNCIFSISETSAFSPNSVFLQQNLTYHNLTLRTELFTGSSAQKTFVIFLLCILLLLLLPFLLSLYLSYHAYDSITKIIAMLGGATDPDLLQKNELDYIQLNIKNMFTRQHELESDLAARIYQLKKMQTLTLQTQFNPHFLFNTINLAIIKEVSVTRCDTTVTKILGLLSNLLRISLDTKHYIVTVEQELEYAKTYLDIISIRYNHNFDIEYHIAPETLPLLTVKLILQPLLENAIEHGLQHMPSDHQGKIVICSHVEQSNLILTVYNNGAPCPKETLTKLHETLKTEHIPSDSHIGLVNINTRIKLLFGSQYGCSIDSDESGTSCTITLPVKKE